jgi:HAMP domain-containing protein
MDAGTLLVMIVGAVGLIAMLWLRTRTHRQSLRHRASLMDLQHRPPASVDDATREQALLLLDRDEKIAAIKLVHERGGLGLREARDFVTHLEATTTFVPNDPSDQPAHQGHDWGAPDSRPAHQGHDWRAADNHRSAQEHHDWRVDDGPAQPSSDWSSSDSGSQSSSDWSSSDSSSSDSGSSSSSE